MDIIFCVVISKDTVSFEMVILGVWTSLFFCCLFLGCLDKCCVGIFSPVSTHQVYIHTYIHTYIHIYVYIYIHTHTHIYGI
jgi:hypothetical protein